MVRVVWFLTGVRGGGAREGWLVGLERTEEWLGYYRGAGRWGC